MKDAVLIQINKACQEKDFNKMLTLCKDYDMPFFGMFLSTALARQRNGIKTEENEGLKSYYKYFSDLIIQKSGKKIKIKLLCNWTSSEELSKLWFKMKPDNCNIELVTNDPDFWIIINKPLNQHEYIPERTLVFQMEPFFDFGINNLEQFMGIYNHNSSYNNIEWHLSLNYESLLNISPKKTKVLSTILSDKYYDPGHILRIDFVKYIDNFLDIDVYGNNIFSYNNYKGNLPYHNKDNSLFPYKYHFNAENNAIDNYFTEKIIDAILSECLCFYWGCPNISKWIDPRAYVQLELKDFEQDLKCIQSYIENDEWGKRIDIIRLEKERILKEMSFFPRIQNILR